MNIGVSIETSGDVEDAKPAVFETHLEAGAEAVAGFETFHEWLEEDPTHRYRLRSALNTLDIKSEKYLGKGYVRQPFINAVEFCERLGLVDISGKERRAVARTFLAGCMELKTLLSNKSESSQNLSNFSQLPYPMQVLASVKAINGEYDTAGYKLTDERERLNIQKRFGQTLQATPEITEDILRSAAIVYADQVLESALDVDDGEQKLERANVEPGVLKGTDNIELGIYLGHDLESAVAESISTLKTGVLLDTLLKDEELSYLDDARREKYETFWQKVDQTLERALDIAAIPQGERGAYKSYLFAKSIFTDIFKPRRVLGYHGGLGQLTTWPEPIADEKYEKRYGYARQWLEAASNAGYDENGINLAKQSFAVGVIDRLDKEVIEGRDRKRTGRLKVLGKLLTEIEETNPELIDHALEFRPALTASLRRAMDPWRYKYDNIERYDFGR